MSIFNNLYPNAIDITSRKVTANEVWVDDPDVPGAKAKLVPGGGGGGESHYYNKANSIKIDAPGVTSYTQIDQDSVDVQNNDTVTAASLLSNKLVLTDSIDTVELTKADIQAANRLKNIIDGGNIEASAKVVTYNTATKALSYETNWNYLQSARVYFTSMASICQLDPVQLYLANGSTNINVSYNQIAVTKVGVTKNLTFEDVDVTNKLKALTTATPGVNSKMLIYDTSTKAFNHTDIPSGTVPYYVKTSSIEMVGGADTLNIYPTGIQVSNGSETYTMGVSDAKITDNLKYLSSTSPGTNSRSVIYNTVTKAFNYANSPGVSKKITMNSAGFFTVVTDPLTGASNTFKTYSLNDNDSLIIDCTGGNYMSYNQWRALRVTPAGTNNYTVKIEVVKQVDGNWSSPNAGTRGTDRYDIADVVWFHNPSVITSTVTVPARSLLFQLINSNATKSTGDYFQGYLRITLLTTDVTALTEATFT